MSETNSDILEFNLDDYCGEMGYNPKEASFLLIHTPFLFFEELEKQLPEAIAKHREFAEIYPHDSTKNLPRFLYGGYTKVCKID